MRTSIENEYEGEDLNGQLFTFKFNRTKNAWEASKGGSRAVVAAHDELPILKKFLYVSEISKREPVAA